MSCETTCVGCYKDWISCGPYNSVITVNTGLDSGNYTAILTDKFDHKYQLSVTVNDSGQFEINFADLPDGLFNEFGGAVLLEMLQNGCDKVTIPIAEGYDYIDTECIEITVKGGTMEKMEIGCRVLTLGPELITNGGFTGNAAGWTLESGWVYSGNMVTFTNMSGVTELKQAGLLTEGARYRVSFDIAGSNGFVLVRLANGSSQVAYTNAGTVIFDGVWSNTVEGFKIIFTPSPLFDGSIDNVSLKQIT